MKILFMGTPDFAMFSLRALVEGGHEIVGVVSQPDKPKGRGYALMPPPVKVFAEGAGLPVYQPATLRDSNFAELLAQLNPELIVVAAYGKILPESVLRFPKRGCINVHGSLLPEYRGAAPIQRAILDGKTVTGITIMDMDVGLDTGDMLLQKAVPLTDEDNFETLHDKLGICGAELLLQAVEALENGSCPRTPQNDAQATYAAKITKADALLNFDADSQTVYNQIRALSPVPLAFTHTPDRKILKVTAAQKTDDQALHDTVGEVLSLDGGITVACAKGSVTFCGVLPEGKSRMTAEAFVCGKKVALGDVLK